MKTNKQIFFLCVITLISVLTPQFEVQTVKALEVEQPLSQNLNNEGILRTIYCSTAKEIQDAMKNAIPGDKIIIKEGEYVGPWTTDGYFYSNSSGTIENPIIIESENINNMSILAGLRVSAGSTVYIVGSNWIIRNLKITQGQKGIMIDKGQNNTITNCEIYGIGQEAVHFRDGSSNNIISNTKVYNTGIFNASYGEGIYVGSDKGKWNEYIKECNNNIIRNCTIGPNVRAEHVDIKEGTTGTIVENSTFYGEGMSGANYADSFIDVKGNNSIIRSNKGYRNNNSKILDAFQIHQQVDGWGLSNWFYDNEVNLDDSVGYILDTTKGTGTVFNNIRNPKGNTYKGNYTELEIKPEDINRDGKIDLLDLSEVSKAYNKSSTNIEYKNSLDLNNDKIIDLFDLVKVSKLISD